MLQITARLFKDNQLYGYRITDGQQIIDATKSQAWLFAKQKEILNVNATGSGNEGDWGLTGTNGKIVVAPPDSNCKTIVDWVIRGYITCDNEIPAKQLEVNENSVKYIVNNKTMKELMKTSESDAKFLNNLALQYKEKSEEAEEILLRAGDDIVRQTRRTQKEVKQKLKETSGIRGIFKAFKR